MSPARPRAQADLDESSVAIGELRAHYQSIKEATAETRADVKSMRVDVASLATTVTSLAATVVTFRESVEKRLAAVEAETRDYVEKKIGAKAIAIWTRWQVWAISGVASTASFVVGLVFK